MKKLLFLFCVSLFFVSCDTFSVQDWVIEMTQVTSISPSTSGYPKTVYTTVEKSGITSVEADAVCKQLTMKTTSSSGGYTVTINTTAAKYLKKDYKPRSTTTTTTEKF